jgi:hypothetical protein
VYNATIINAHSKFPHFHRIKTKINDTIPIIGTYRKLIPFETEILAPYLSDSCCRLIKFIKVGTNYKGQPQGNSVISLKLIGATFSTKVLFAPHFLQL